MFQIERSIRLINRSGGKRIIKACIRCIIFEAVCDDRRESENI